MCIRDRCLGRDGTSNKQTTRKSNIKSPRTSWLRTEFPKYQNHHGWRADTPTNQSPILILDFLKTDFLQPDKMALYADYPTRTITETRIRTLWGDLLWLVKVLGLFGRNEMMWRGGVNCTTCGYGSTYIFFDTFHVSEIYRELQHSDGIIPRSCCPGAVSYTHLTLPTIYSV